MPRYNVTTRVDTTQTVQADNPHLAAIKVGGYVIAVNAARGRPPKAKTARKPRKRVAKQTRKPLSAATRKKLAANLAKARAAKAKKARKQK